MRSELFEEAWKQNRHVWESTKCLAQAMYLAGEQHQQAKNDELQKRVDAALKETLNALHYVEGDIRGNFDFLQVAMIRTFKELKKTLESSNAKSE